VVLSPSKSIGLALSLAGKNLRVGNPLIEIPSTSFKVESILAITTLGLPAIYLAAASQ
jgi:hypothetical protein